MRYVTSFSFFFRYILSLYSLYRSVFSMEYPLDITFTRPVLCTSTPTKFCMEYLCDCEEQMQIGLSYLIQHNWLSLNRASLLSRLNSTFFMICSDMFSAFLEDSYSFIFKFSLIPSSFIKRTFGCIKRLIRSFLSR